MIADLVEQQTTTTGTGAYTVSGSVTGRRTFADAFATNDVVPYMATDDAGAFECGFGTWTEGTLSLARTYVVASSNAGAAVSWAAGTKRLYVTANASSSALAQQRHNLAASAAPTVNEDAAAGYGVGSLWLWEASTGGGSVGNKGMWMCVDPTAGDAVWIEVVAQNYFRADADDPQIYFTGRFTDRGSLYHYGRRGVSFSGCGYAVLAAVADIALVPLAAVTTNNTPKNMGYDGDYATYRGLMLDTPGTYCIEGKICAFESATSNSRTWTVDAVVKVAANYTTTVLSGGTPAAGYNSDTGLSALAVSFTSPSSNNATVAVTGDTGKTIIWSAGLRVTVAGDGL